MEVTELRTESEWREAWPVMRELRNQLDEREYLALLDEMAPEGYRLFALRERGAIVALAGIAVLTNLYHGRHVWVYDLVATETARSRGHGRTLLSYVEDFARAQGCGMVALASGTQRTDAHRFYEQRMGYARPSYVFAKRLGSS